MPTIHAPLRAIRPKRTSLQAFTLVELLTVIAIIAVLAGIIIPVIGHVRARAREAQGASNLRQIGVAALSYAGDHQGKLPYGQSFGPDGDFRTAISSYLSGGTEGSYNDKLGYNRVFIDPSAAVEGGSNHYTTNPSVMWYSNKPFPQVRLTQITRPSQVVLFFDGAQIPGSTYNNSAEAVGWAVDGGSVNPGGTLNPATARNVIAPGPNQDSTSTQANIRWRARNNTAAKFVFADGHSAILEKKDLQKRHFFPQ
jgi:prepilin-type N-terminal cleavage/methylation domain-containing protein